MAARTEVAGAAAYAAVGVAELLWDESRHPLGAGWRVVAKKELAPGTVVVREIGCAVAASESGAICPVCFDMHTSTQEESELAPCRALAAREQRILAPLMQAGLFDELQAYGVDRQLVLLWLRVINLAATTSDDLPAPAAARLQAWRDTLWGLAHQDVSAPSDTWLNGVTMAAVVLVQGLPPAVVAAATDLLLPLVQQSSHGESSGSLVEVLVLLAGMLNRNGYSVRAAREPNRETAWGHFPVIALVNHSCHPNCAVVSRPGGELEVRTLGTVRAGAELFVSYVDLTLPRAERQAHLLASKEFTCTCYRCQHPDAFPHEHEASMPSCPQCGLALRWTQTSASGKDDTETATCYSDAGGCGAVVTASAVQSRLTEAREALSQAGEPSAVADVVGSLLPEEHALVMQARLRLFARLNKDEAHREGAQEQLAKVAASLSRLVPTLWPELLEFEWLALRSAHALACEGDQSDASRLNSRLTALRSRAERIFGLGHPFVEQLQFST
ncbi:uncharacterized protein MONBRDRAFT_9299 [Monosiga brevicollis MX1]|uniref:SET domain-containing protein n=1 Tax=Monosiga brevicollis TaxID=81824 RepID=A9V2P9_MONBE|nr:uncharacterized protein MONBRDRAFT_9299 [Monosiga brevicollis MX1]EDQ88299.1 predicted protein [Monosiga brevicollis MX1]|eukprot:XP_001746892.1 hypothetical protein [Monosiga brevicollis MX1]